MLRTQQGRVSYFTTRFFVWSRNMTMDLFTCNTYAIKTERKSGLHFVQYRMKPNENKVALLVLGCDGFFYIFRFGYLNFSQGKVPFYSDIQSYVKLRVEHELTSDALFLLSIFLNVSIVVSMALFFIGSRKTSYLIYVQMPLRLLLAVPSLSVFLWLSKAAGATSIIWFVSLLLFSEIVKLLSILFRKKWCI